MNEEYIYKSNIHRYKQEMITFYVKNGII